MINDDERIKCSFCAESILVDAIICKHCKSRVIAPDGTRLKPGDKIIEKESNPKEISLGMAMFQNLMVPGLGTWKLGERMRGATIFVLIAVMSILFAQDVISFLNPAMQKVMSGNLDALDQMADEANSGSWGPWITILYMYSFIDVYLVSKKKKNNT